MTLIYYIEEKDNNQEESLNNYKYLFSNYEKNIPTLEEALNQIYMSAVFDNDKANYLTTDILTRCKKAIDSRFNIIIEKYKNISIDEAYIICSYTCESIEENYSPYKLLNQNLISNNRKLGIKNISKYLYILLKSLRKLDRYYPKPPKKYLYRCISYKVSLVKDPFNDEFIPFAIGNQKKFLGFTSTSPNPKTTLIFLGKNEQIKTGTIFTLTGDIWGYDITLFNYYKEEEILLEPETKFIVENVFPPVNDIIYITCKVLKSPLVLDSDKNQPSLIINDKVIKNINNCIVKIDMEIKINNKSNNIKGIGYLCNITIKNMKVLITYSHVINLECLNKMNTLIIYINNKELEIDMKIDRFKCINEKLDVTIIEILEEDNICTYLEIDKFIESKNYINENIEVIYLQNENSVNRINGKIIKKNNNNYICNIKSIKNGIIILNSNSKLIGIIKENNNNDLIEFIPMNIIINNINYIKCTYKIKSDDLGKNIQILNDTRFNDRNKIINKEILDKIKIIINGEIISNTLTYIFKHEGLYTIYIISYNLINNMSNMFYECSTLEEINLLSFNTTQVTNLSNMFYGCSSLKEINLSSFNTSQVTNMSSMFDGCSSLKELDLSSFNTDKVTNMSWMFYNCSSLKEINLSSFNTSQVTNMSWMFDGCSSLKEINLSSFNTNQMANLNYMFSHCSSLKKINCSDEKILKEFNENNHSTSCCIII